MRRRETQGRVTAVAGLLALVVAGAGAPAGLRAERFDPGTVVPMNRIAPEARASVAEVIGESSFHHKGQPETFPCDPQLYLSLLNDPVLTLALWQDLADSPSELAPVGPGRYYGNDGNGTSASWQFVLRSPQMHVLLGEIAYRSPRGTAHLEGRLVLIIRTSYFKESSGEPWIQHEVEAFVKIDSRGWRAVARTVRPLIERLLEEQLQEAGWFISLMGRLVASYPDWAAQVVATQPHLPPQARAEIHQVIDHARRPDAQPGRPMLADNGAGTTR